MDDKPITNVDLERVFRYGMTVGRRLAYSESLSMTHTMAAELWRRGYECQLQEAAQLSELDGVYPPEPTAAEKDLIAKMNDLEASHKPQPPSRTQRQD